MVAVVNSTLKPGEHEVVLAEIAVGLVEFVYATHERLAPPAFREVLKRTTVDLIVVDEAHCASQWGHDFRPEYLALNEAIDELGRPTVLALTATATPEVIDDIRRQHRLDDATIVHMGIDRPNLTLEVIKAAGEAEKRSAIARVLGEVHGPAIIYTATVKAVDGLVEFLGSRGFEAGTYHGRLGAAARASIHDRSMIDSWPVNCRSWSPPVPSA